MVKENTQSEAGKSLGIAGLVVGIIALVFSFIPCLGMIALLPGVVAVILSLVGIIIASQKNGAKGLTIAAFIISLLACAIAGYQTRMLMDATANMKGVAEEINKNYTSCDELINGYEVAINNFISIKHNTENSQEVMESNEPKNLSDAFNAFSSISEITTSVAIITNIKQKSIAMGCSEDEAYIEKLAALDKKYAELTTNTNFSEELEEKETFEEEPSEEMK